MVGARLRAALGRAIGAAARAAVFAAVFVAVVAAGPRGALGAQAASPAAVPAPAGAPITETAPAEIPGARVFRAGRIAVVAFAPEERLARALLADALARDSFPGLARPRDTVTVMLAPDAATFREWAGGGAPEWGGAFAFPGERLIVMQGRDAGADAGEPRQTLRHELAHLALAEGLGAGVPRWFDEGYASVAAGEWGRDEVLATSVGLVWRGAPTLRGLDSLFQAGPDRASRAYALAHHAVAELQAMGRERGLSLLFEHWRAQGAFEPALRLAYGMSGGDFERAWGRKVRRQYGVLALGADVALLTAILSFFLAPLWWQKRKRQRERLERLRAADALQEARERESALAALLGETPGRVTTARPTPAGERAAPSDSAPRPD